MKGHAKFEWSDYPKNGTVTKKKKTSVGFFTLFLLLFAGASSAITAFIVSYLVGNEKTIQANYGLKATYVSGQTGGLPVGNGEITYQVDFDNVTYESYDWEYSWDQVNWDYKLDINRQDMVIRDANSSQYRITTLTSDESSRITIKNIDSVARIFFRFIGYDNSGASAASNSFVVQGVSPSEQTLTLYTTSPDGDFRLTPGESIVVHFDIVGNQKITNPGFYFLDGTIVKNGRDSNSGFVFNLSSTNKELTVTNPAGLGGATSAFGGVNIVAKCTDATGVEIKSTDRYGAPVNIVPVTPKDKKLTIGAGSLSSLRPFNGDTFTLDIQGKVNIEDNTSIVWQWSTTNNVDSDNGWYDLPSVTTNSGYIGNTLYQVVADADKNSRTIKYMGNAETQVYFRVRAQDTTITRSNAILSHSQIVGRFVSVTTAYGSVTDLEFQNVSTYALFKGHAYGAIKTSDVKWQYYMPNSGAIVPDPIPSASFIDIPFDNQSSSTSNTYANQQATGFTILKTTYSDGSPDGTTLKVTNTGNSSTIARPIIFRIVSLKADYDASAGAIISNEVRVNGSQKTGAISLQILEGSTSPLYGQTTQIGSTLASVSANDTIWQYSWTNNESDWYDLANQNYQNSISHDNMWFFSEISLGAATIKVKNLCAAGNLSIYVRCHSLSTSIQVKEEVSMKLTSRNASSSEKSVSLEITKGSASLKRGASNATEITAKLFNITPVEVNSLFQWSVNLPAGVSGAPKSANKSSSDFLVYSVYDQSYQLDAMTEFQVEVKLGVEHFAATNLIVNRPSDTKLDMSISTTSYDANTIQSNVIPYGKNVVIDVAGEYLVGNITYQYNGTSAPPATAIVQAADSSRPNNSRIIISNVLSGSGNGSFTLVANNNGVSSQTITFYYFGSQYSGDFAVITPYMANDPALSYNEYAQFYLTQFTAQGGAIVPTIYTQDVINQNSYTFNNNNFRWRVLLNDLALDKPNISFEYSLFNNQYPMITVHNNGYVSDNQSDPHAIIRPKISFVDSTISSKADYTSLEIIPIFFDTQIALALTNGMASTIRPTQTNELVPVIFDRPNSLFTNARRISYVIESGSTFSPGTVVYSLDKGMTWSTTWTGATAITVNDASTQDTPNGIMFRNVNYSLDSFDITVKATCNLRQSATSTIKVRASEADIVSVLADTYTLNFNSSSPEVATLEVIIPPGAPTTGYKWEFIGASASYLEMTASVTTTTTVKYRTASPVDVGATIRCAIDEDSDGTPEYASYITLNLKASANTLAFDVVNIDQVNNIATPTFRYGSQSILGSLVAWSVSPSFGVNPLQMQTDGKIVLSTGMPNTARLYTVTGSYQNVSLSIQIFVAQNNVPSKISVKSANFDGILPTDSAIDERSYLIRYGDQVTFSIVITKPLTSTFMNLLLIPSGFRPDDASADMVWYAAIQSNTAITYSSHVRLAKQGTNYYFDFSQTGTDQPNQRWMQLIVSGTYFCSEGAP